MREFWLDEEVKEITASCKECTGAKGDSGRSSLKGCKGEVMDLFGRKLAVYAHALAIIGSHIFSLVIYPFN